MNGIVTYRVCPFCGEAARDCSCEVARDGADDDLVIAKPKKAKPRTYARATGAVAAMSRMDAVIERRLANASREAKESAIELDEVRARKKAPRRRIRVRRSEN